MSIPVNNVDALILCGGLGTRLRSKFPDTPKILAPLAGRPFLDILLEYLQTQGIRRIILCTGHLSDKVEAFCRQVNDDWELHFSIEKKPLGTGGALNLARDKILSDPFFVFNGDSFCAIDLYRVLAAHKEMGNKATIVLSAVDDARDYGTVVLDETNRVCAFEEKNPERQGAQLVNVGVYCLNKELFQMMPSQEKFSVERDIFPQMSKEFIGGYVTDKPFYDFGTPERFLLVEKYFSDRKLSL